MARADPPPRVARTVQLELGTGIGWANTHHVSVRGFDVAEDLVGEVSYTEMALLTITGRRPTEGEVRVVDAVLVSLVDHGLQPSALVTRLTYHVAPEAIQAAVAAGLLGAGSLLLGSMEQCGRLLTDVRTDVAAGAAPRAAVRARLQTLLDQGRRVPGVGHGLHREGDPRATKLLAVAEREGIARPEVEHLQLVAEEAATLTQRSLPLNTTGATAALLLGVGIPWNLHRGFALISRCAGLIAHVGEESETPMTPAVRQALRDASWLDE
ncbi:MAG: citryl-CoA lyase [Candidatus Dormibacter sp.]